ncbi:MAG: cytochrome c-type biogenesis protein CcmH, partial [Dehalococcoidia bacterium]
TPPTTPRPPPPDPVALYTAMGTEMASLPSFSLSVSIMKVEKTVPEHIEIDIVVPDRVRISFGALGAGEAFEWTQVLVIGGDLYLRFPGSPGEWVSIPPEQKVREEVPDVFEFLSTVFDSVSELSYVGRETVEGVSIHRVQGAVGAGALALRRALDTPSLEERAQSLDRRLMCPVCPAETIDQTQAEIALQMRQMVRSKLQAGEGEQQIMDYFVDKYGQSVLAELPAEDALAHLWIGAADSLLYRLRLEISPGGDILEIEFSLFGSSMAIEPPESFQDITLFETLSGGAIVGTLISTLPREHQECLIDRLGEEAYDALVSGTPVLGLNVALAIQECLQPLFGD